MRHKNSEAFHGKCFTEGAVFRESLESDPGTLSGTKAATLSLGPHGLTTLAICFLSSLFRSAFTIPLSAWQKMSAPQSTSLQVPQVQQCPDSGCILESKSPFLGKFQEQLLAKGPLDQL